MFINTILNCKHEISGAESKVIISFYKSFLISMLLFLLLVTALVLCPSSFLLLGEMVRQHHRLSGTKSEQALGGSRGQGRLTCCGSWGRRESRHVAAEQQQGEVMRARVTLQVLKSVLQKSSSLVTILALYIGWFKYLQLSHSLGEREGWKPNLSNVNKKKGKRKPRFLGSYPLECKFISLGRR